MNEKNRKLISGFLSDKLSKEEKAEFLKKASTDKAFIKEIVKEIELDDAINEILGMNQEEED
jgi:hypothetical protein